MAATTENPSFELNNALLSRARVYVLKMLDPETLVGILERALGDEERGLADRFTISDEELELIATAADGDARRALNLLELAADLSDDGSIGGDIVADVVAGGRRRFDNKGEYFYDQISALHKSIRGSDPDASLYWLMRMLDGGCDPLYVARRMIRGSRPRTSAMPTRGRCNSLSMRGRHSNVLAAPRASWPWHRPSSISPVRQRAMPSTARPGLQPRRRANRAHSRCRCTCEMRLPGS